MESISNVASRSPLNHFQLGNFGVSVRVPDLTRILEDRADLSLVRKYLSALVISFDIMFKKAEISSFMTSLWIFQSRDRW